MNQDNKKNTMSALMVGSIGVVFGDIGTSPLYAFKECLKPFADGLNITSDSIYGICSLIFWCITLVVTLKYVMFVMRADNKGEGGILALVSLADRVTPAKFTKYIWIMGLIGAATFYGDSVITPAISVLSAVEGIGKIQSNLSHFIMPISVSIIFLLFLFQKFGTHTVGKLFGPIMILWFIVLAGLGVYHIIDHPAIMLSLNPYYALKMTLLKPQLALVITGAVFLTLTGAEALYSDLGHCGRKNIRISWILVKTCLILNYFGQGAWLLANHNGQIISPEMIDSGFNPFYGLMPHWFRLVGLVIATTAAIIASQALISGSFTLISEAMRLNLWPRLKIVYPSEERGQLFIPAVNMMLLAGCCCLCVCHFVSAQT